MIIHPFIKNIAFTKIVYIHHILMKSEKSLCSLLLFFILHWNDWVCLAICYHLYNAILDKISPMYNIILSSYKFRHLKSNHAQLLILFLLVGFRLTLMSCLVDTGVRTKMESLDRGASYWVLCSIFFLVWNLVYRLFIWLIAISHLK